MKIAFTICSNNYLAQAKTLGDSLMQTNPDYRFVIGLVDVLSEIIDYSFFAPFEIIPIDKIGIGGFEEMTARYNITELNTAVKPYFFNFLLKRDTDADTIIYFDPDIQIYQKLAILEEALEQNNIVLTPHFITPIFDHYRLSEPDILNTGIFNLGFLGVKRSDETGRFLSWWMIKLWDQCRIDLAKGLFVDQLWINFVPVYFSGVFILKDVGYNMAYWNLHERSVASIDKEYLVNGQRPLTFYHFSGFDFNKPNIISKYQNRFSFDQRPDVKPIFLQYTDKVLANGFEKLSSIPCRYISTKKEVRKKDISNLTYRDHFYLIRQKLKKDILNK